MISLGGIALDDNLRLDGLETGAQVAASARLTMGGVVIQTIPMPSGRLLTLNAEMDGDRLRGYFTQAQIDAIAALRDAAEAITLVHHRGTFQVWIPVDGLAVLQGFGFSDPDSSSWYYGTITLITV